MKVKIEERRDYELHVRNLVNKNLKMKLLMKKTVVALVMQAFDDGSLFSSNSLEVNI